MLYYLRGVYTPVNAIFTPFLAILTCPEKETTLSTYPTLPGEKIQTKSCLKGRICHYRKAYRQLHKAVDATHQRRNVFFLHVLKIFVQYDMKSLQMTLI